MNDEEISARALEAWPAAEPPPGFANRVLAARKPGPRARSGRRIALAAAALLVVFAGARAAYEQRPVAGQKFLSTRETIALGRRGLAVAEAGARLSWTVSAGGAAHIQQAAGDAFYRVEPGGPFVVAAPGAEVTATGTCFRVEVKSMATAMENTRAALVGAAAASLVLVTVYEGRVRVRHGEGESGAVVLRAGEQLTFRAPPGAASTAIPRPPVAVAPAPAPALFDSAPPAALRARIAELESQVATLTAAKGNAPPAADFFGKVRDFSQEELRRFAKNCELHMGVPAYGSTTPTFDPDEARKLSVSQSEVEQVNEILAAQNTEFNRAMREIYVAATGDAAGAEQLDASAMVHEMIAKTPPEQLAAARREVALENAGLAKAPANPASEPAVTRMFRLQNGSGAKLNDALAASLGHAEAEHVLDALTPMHLAFTGCPAEAR